MNNELPSIRLSNQNKGFDYRILEKSFLKVDNTILDIAAKVAERVNEQYKTDTQDKLSTEEILILVEHVFRSVAVGVKKGDMVKIPAIGKFCIKRKRRRYLEEDTIEMINEANQLSVDEALVEILNN